MKQIKTLFVLVLTLMFSLTVSGQSIQGGWSFEVNGEYVLCLDEPVTGGATYHAVFHIDKKTGYLKSVHWNLTSCSLVGDSGTEYNLIDTGKDIVGWYWDFFTSVGLDGSLLPPTYPVEGTFIDNYIIVAKKTGRIFSGKILFQFHINANGEVTVNVLDYNFCI